MKSLRSGSIFSQQYIKKWLNNSTATCIVWQTVRIFFTAFRPISSLLVSFSNFFRTAFFSLIHAWKQKKHLNKLDDTHVKTTWKRVAVRTILLRANSMAGTSPAFPYYLRGCSTLLRTQGFANPVVIHSLSNSSLALQSANHGPPKRVQFKIINISNIFNGMLVQLIWM